jgi:uncharacterized repeat protein (TIGR03803 family)
MLRILDASRRYILGYSLALSLLIPLSSAGAESGETVLYKFCSQANCADGGAPSSSLIMDASGNLYGTTTQGGANGGCPEIGSGFGCGTVFKVAPDGTETVLYSFCSQANCSDGATPAASLMMDGAGNLYGTSATGGSENDNYPCGQHGCGTVFKLSFNGNTWTETVLYAFLGGSDGSGPQAGLIMDGVGNLYGTTSQGGAPDAGTVFELAANGTETVLHTFTRTAGDGYIPSAGLVMDRSGNLYGTTILGGDQSCPASNDGCGIVFKLSPNGSSWTETVLHAFTGGSDGAWVWAGLISDREGNLYGTTSKGGSGGACEDNGGNGCGTVFKLAPDGTETILYAFKGGIDGADPSAGLIRDYSGNFYGTTGIGGAHDTCDRGKLGCGTVFELTPSGTEKVVYSFKRGPTGSYPTAGLMMDAPGNLYGTTDFGGGKAHCGKNHFAGCGVVFRTAPFGDKRNRSSESK